MSAQLTVEQTLNEMNAKLNSMGEVMHKQGQAITGLLAEVENLKCQADPKYKAAQARLAKVKALAQTRYDKFTSNGLGATMSTQMQQQIYEQFMAEAQEEIGTDEAKPKAADSSSSDSSDSSEDEMDHDREEKRGGKSGGRGGRRNSLDSQDRRGRDRNDRDRRDNTDRRDSRDRRDEYKGGSSSGRSYYDRERNDRERDDNSTCRYCNVKFDSNAMRRDHVPTCTENPRSRFYRRR